MIDLLTTAQAAAHLGLSVRRVQQLIKAGILPATRLGHQWLIAEADLAQATNRPPVGYPAGRPRRKEKIQ